MGIFIYLSISTLMSYPLDIPTYILILIHTHLLISFISDKLNMRVIKCTNFGKTKYVNKLLELTVIQTHTHIYMQKCLFVWINQASTDITHFMRPLQQFYDSIAIISWDYIATHMHTYTCTHTHAYYIKYIHNVHLNVRTPFTLQVLLYNKLCKCIYICCCMCEYMCAY